MNRNWLNFYHAAEEVQQRLRVSVGVARRMLRDACATGDVRSQREPYDPKTGAGEGPPELVKPSDWKRDEVDLVTDADGCDYFVDVDEADFHYWLDNLPKSTRKRRGAPKTDLVRKTIAALNLPAGMTNGEVHQRIAEKLKADGIRDIPHLSVVKRARAKKSTT
jgi:hypothetical protein